MSFPAYSGGRRAGARQGLSERRRAEWGGRRRIARVQHDEPYRGGRHRCVHAVKGPSATFGSPPKTVQQITTSVSFDHEFTFVGPLMNLFGGSLGTVSLKAVSTMRLEAN